MTTNFCTETDINYLYHGLQMTGEQIANSFGVSRMTMYRYMNKIGIKMRTKKEAGKMFAPKGKSHYGWNGGKCISSGYLRYSFGKNRGKYIHVCIAEKALGRKLKDDEVVHHINSNKLDNRKSNLLVCSLGFHTWLHHKMRGYDVKQRHGA